MDLLFFDNAMDGYMYAKAVLMIAPRKKPIRAAVEEKEVLKVAKKARRKAFAPTVRPTMREMRMMKLAYASAGK